MKWTRHFLIRRGKMTTIAQTLLDIEQVQQDIQMQLSSGKLQLSKFN